MKNKEECVLQKNQAYNAYAILSRHTLTQLFAQ